MADKKMDNRMVVLTENLTGKKYIVWHGPTEVYNTDFTLRGANGDSFTPYADVNYSVDDIRYVFKLREKYFPDDRAIDISLTDLQNLRKDKGVPMSIDGINGTYWNNRNETTYWNEYNNANFFYYPENLCVPKVEVSNPNPTLFNEKTPINIVTYSNTEFISGETKETQNTLPYKPLPYAKIAWDDKWDSGNTVDGTANKTYTEEPTSAVQWPLIVKYDPIGISTFTSNSQNYTCWLFAQNSFVPDLVFDKYKDEVNNFYCEKQVAQLQFQENYGLIAERNILQWDDNSNTTYYHQSFPWHFHFNTSKGIAGKWYYYNDKGEKVYIASATQNDGPWCWDFVRTHPYCLYELVKAGTSTSTIGAYGVSDCEVILKVKDRNGKYCFSNVWCAHPNKTYNMYARWYGSALPNVDWNIKYLQLKLKSAKCPSSHKESMILINYLQPFCRVNNNYGYRRQEYIMSYHVADDIWMCEEGPSSTEVQLIPERPNPKGIFNSTKPDDWIDGENTANKTGNKMDQFVWKGVEYVDRYSLIKDIFETPQFTDRITAQWYQTGGYGYGFLWCEEVKSNIDAPTGIVDFGEFLYSTNPNVTLGQEDERLYTTKIDVKSSDATTLKNIYGVKWSGSQNKYIPCYGRIANKADITENEFVLYRTWLVVQNEVVGCGFHKILDSGIEFKISEKTPEGNSGEHYALEPVPKGSWSSRPWSITGVYETADDTPTGTVTKLTYKVSTHGSTGNTYAWKYCHSSNWNDNMLYKAYPTVDELLADDD